MFFKFLIEFLWLCLIYGCDINMTCGLEVVVVERENSRESAPVQLRLERPSTNFQDMIRPFCLFQNFIYRINSRDEKFYILLDFRDLCWDLGRWKSSSGNDLWRQIYQVSLKKFKVRFVQNKLSNTSMSDKKRFNYIKIYLLN